MSPFLIERPADSTPQLIARECRCCRYKGKKVHVIFFGDDTEAWCDVNKMKSPFLDHVEAHGKNKRVVAAVEQAHVWLSQSAANGTGGDDRDVEPDMADADADDMTAPIAAVTGDEEQAASAKTTTEAGSESGESIPPPMSTDGAKQTEQLGDGGGDDAGTGGDEDEDEDEDEQDDGSGGDDEDDDDLDLSLSEGSDDDGPAFEPKSRKSSKPAAKRKAAARGAPSAKRSRSNGGAARRVQKEKEHDDPVPEVELRDAPLTELASLRAQADEGISAFAEASTVVDSLSASRLKLEAKLDKVKKQEKQAAKLQQDAKAKIRKALKDVAGCKMTVTALKETKWGRTVKKLSKFEGDANISKVADAQMNRWKASVSVESDASVASAETQEKQPQGADQGNPSPQPEAAAATDDSAQPEHPQQAESNDPRGNGQGAGTTVVPQKPAQTLAAPSGDAEAEAAATEKLRAKVICYECPLVITIELFTNRVVCVP